AGAAIVASSVARSPENIFITWLRTSSLIRAAPETRTNRPPALSTVSVSRCERIMAAGGVQTAGPRAGERSLGFFLEENSLLSLACAESAHRPPESDHTDLGRSRDDFGHPFRGATPPALTTVIGWPRDRERADDRRSRADMLRPTIRRCPAWRRSSARPSSRGDSATPESLRPGRRGARTVPRS